MTKCEMREMIGPKTTNLAKVLYYMAGVTKPITTEEIAKGTGLPIASVRGVLSTNGRQKYGEIYKEVDYPVRRYKLIKMLRKIDAEEVERKRVEAIRKSKEKVKPEISDRDKLLNMVFNGG